MLCIFSSQPTYLLPPSQVTTQHPYLPLTMQIITRLPLIPILALALLASIVNAVETVDPTWASRQ